MKYCVRRIQLLPLVHLQRVYPGRDRYLAGQLASPTKRYRDLHLPTCRRHPLQSRRSVMMERSHFQTSGLSEC